MSNSKIWLKTFIGYQLTSSFHSSNDFKIMGEALNRFLSEISPYVQLDIDFGDLPPGAQLWNEVQHRIESSQVTIFDISENNANVLLEAGIAFGKGRHVILLRCEQSKNDAPSDLRSFVYLPYQNSNTLSQESFLRTIATSISYFLKYNHDPYFYHRLIWSLSPSSKTIIVPGRLPKKKAANRFEDYIHLRAFSDLDAVFTVVETIHRLYPSMEISMQAAKSTNDLPQNWGQANIIFVGGPDFNLVVRDFETLCPLEYRHGETETDIWLYHKRSGIEFKPQFYHTDGQRRAKDYGFFLKRKTAKHHDTKLIFIGGCHTWGVFGAAMLVGCTGYDKQAPSYVNAKLLVENFGSDPLLLVPVEVSGSEVAILPPVLSLDQIEEIS